MNIVCICGYLPVTFKNNAGYVSMDWCLLETVASVTIIFFNMEIISMRAWNSDEENVYHCPHRTSNVVNVAKDGFQWLMFVKLGNERLLWLICFRKGRVY